jgi:hypothetical protein
MAKNAMETVQSFFAKEDAFGTESTVGHVSHPVRAPCGQF